MAAGNTLSTASTLTSATFTTATATPASASTSTSTSAPSFQESMIRSTEVWQNDLESLFHGAKDRFPDVVWEVGEDEDHVEEVWGHKAIVYARAPPSFQSRYFKAPGALGLDMSMALSRTPSPSPFRASPAPSTITANTSGRTTPQPNSAANPLRLHASITPALFANELEYLYTGQGFGEAFEFLFDSSHESGGLLGLGGEDEDIDAEELRIDKLRKDLVFMWRSRLYSDVKIALHVAATSSSTAKEAISSSGNKEHESTTAVFSTHKFILASRSAYFRNLLSSSPSSSKALVPATPSSKPSSTYFIDPTTLLPTLTLPSPPFTPASLHFTLGYLYTGTLAFSHRTYDLSTAFAIFLSARHLNLRELEEEVRARIIMEMAHGLFHAFLSFPEYERVTGGVWGSPALPVSSAHGHHHSLSISSLAGVTSSHTSSTRGGSGCRCKPCSRRAPRILQFALSLPSSQSDIYLDRGARRALVGLYGEGWVTQEYASLSARVRESVGRGVRKRVWGVDATTTGTTGNAKDGKDGVGKDSGSTTRGPGDKPQTQTQSHVKASTKTKTKSRGRANGNVFRILWAGEAALNGKLAQKGGNGSQQVSFAHGNSGTINGRRTLTNDDDPMGMGNGVSVGVGGPDRAPWLEIVRSDLIKGRDACDEYLAERCEEAFRVPREIRRLLRRDVVDGFDNDRDGDVKMDDVEDQQDDKEGLENEDEEDVAQEWYDILMRGSVIASSFGPGVNSGATSSGHGHPSSIASYPSTSYSTLTSSLPGYGSSYPADQLYTDSLHLTQIVSSVLRGLNEGNAGRVYQVLVANVLLLPNPFSSGTGGSGSVGGDGALLSGTSHVRVQVEQTRLEILAWIKKRWRGVREAGGFLLVGEEWTVKVKDKDGVREEVKEGKMEGWAVKEIADYIEVPIEDLQHPSGTTGTSTPTSINPQPHYGHGHSNDSSSRSNTPTQQRLRVKNGADSDMLSVNSAISASPSMAGSTITTNSMTPSMRVAILARKAQGTGTGGGTGTGSGRLTVNIGAGNRKSSGSQISLRSTSSATSLSGQGQRRREKPIPIGGDRPDSKLTPAGPSPMSSVVELPDVVIESDEDDDDLTEGGGGKRRRSVVDEDEDVDANGDGDGDADTDGDVEMRSSPSTTTSPSPSASPSLRGKGKPLPTSRTGTGAKTTPTPSTTSLRQKMSGPAGSSRASIASSVTSSISPRQPRLGVSPTSRPSSRVSTRSTSTLRRGSGASNTGLAPPGPRPISAATSVSSTTSDGSTTFKTAPSTAGGGTRKRTVSSTSVGSVKSTASAASTNTVGGGTPKSPMTTRKVSGTSRATSPVTTKRPPSVRSVASVSSVRGGRKVSDNSKIPPVPSLDEHDKKTTSVASTASTATLKKKGSGDTITGSTTTPRRSVVGGSGVTRPTASSAAKSAAAAVVAERRASRIAAAAAKNGKTVGVGKKAGDVNVSISVSATPNVPPHLGATLEIGIPCVISSKRKRFRAFARYIGEVEGEVGPWVGVEVPITEGVGGTIDRDMMMSPVPGQGGSGNLSLSSSWTVEGRQWNDGSWGGIRYFEISGSGGSEWGDGIGGYGDDSRMGRRRFGTVRKRGEASGDSYGYGSTIGRGTKRMRIRSASPSASETSGGGVESRGLFVRPQQVLYVVDAIDEDL